MILLLSTQNIEETTNQVIDWIDYFGNKWIRFNSSEEILTQSPFELYISENDDNKTLKFSDTRFNISEIRSIWFRKRGNPPLEVYNLINNVDFRISVNEYFKSEIDTLSMGFFHLLKGKKWLGNPYNASVNKLLSLKTAKSVELSIPETMITNNKNELLYFYESYKKIIIKPIKDSLPFIIDGKIYVLYSELLELETIEKSKDYFFPILVQEYIEKDYELRIFYLDNEIFSMAIFSQGDKKTEVDFRKYNFDKWNRYVPYKLPNQISEKIKSFMRKMEMNTGSIDMIVTKAKRYIFLEVNPVGQFGMVSYPCNYFLEKKVAEKLVQWDK